MPSLAVNWKSVPFNTRPLVAALCIALAVFATIASAIDFEAPAFVLLAAWQIAPIVLCLVITRDEEHAAEQNAAFVRLIVSRPPPLLEA